MASGLSSSSASRAAETCQTFPDGTGDVSGAPGPDISAVEVCYDEADLITFRISIPNRPAGLEVNQDVPYNEYVELFPRTDAQIDYRPLLAPYECEWREWRSEWTSQMPSLNCSYASGVLTIQIKRSEIGEPDNITFQANAEQDRYSDKSSDVAGGMVHFPGQEADISLIKSQSDDQVPVGQKITYTLAVFNGGPATAANVTVTDSPPSGITITSVSASQGTCTGLTCAIGSILPGQNQTMTVVATVTAEGSITNIASASATNDTSAADNTSSVTALGVATTPPPPPPPGPPPPPPPPGGEDAAPVAADDADSAFAGVLRTIHVLANDSDPDGDVLRVVSHTDPRFGRVSCSADSCDYGSEKRGGTDTFTYTVADGRGKSTAATVRVEVAPKRLVVRHIKSKRCGAKKKSKCTRMPAQALQLSTGGEAPAQSLPSRKWFWWKYDAFCSFSGTGANELGNFWFKGAMGETGRSWTNDMRLWVSFEEWGRAWSGLGDYKWIPISIQRLYEGSYPDDRNSYHVLDWVRWNGDFGPHHVGHRVRLRADFQWWRLGANQRLVFQTGWFTLLARNGLCIGEPQPGVERQ